MQTITNLVATVTPNECVDRILADVQTMLQGQQVLLFRTLQEQGNTLELVKALPPRDKMPTLVTSGLAASIANSKGSGVPHEGYLVINDTPTAVSAQECVCV